MIQAVTAYSTLILAGRILGATRFAGLGALYVLINTVATGLFQPLEQEVARRRGRERTTGQVDRSLLRRALVFGMCLCLVVLAVALALHGPTVRLLGGEPQLLAAFGLALPGYVLCFVVRGELSGARRMGRYGLQLSVESTFRLLALGLLFVIGVRSVTAYGWLFGAAPWLAAAGSTIGLRWPLATGDRPDAPRTHLAGPLALLLVSTLAAQLLIGAGPITAQIFSGAAEAAAAGAFLAALVMVRLPVFLFTAVQPSMLPTMSAHVAAGRRAAFRSVLWRVMRVMGLIAAATFVITTALGPPGLKVLFGPDYVLSRSAFALMAVSVALYMTAGVLGQAVLALGHHRLVTAGWLTGLIGLALGMAVASNMIGRAILGLLVGAAASAVTFALLLWRLMREKPRSAPEGNEVVAGRAAPRPVS
jgi:O-antigen/teichoic acid export membrane protein